MKHYLTSFQTDNLMLPKAIRKIMRSADGEVYFGKTLISEKANRAYMLCKMDVFNKTILLPAQLVNIGTITKQAIRASSLPASEKLLLFRNSCPEMPVSFFTKLQNFSPLNYSVVLNHNSLSPILMTGTWSLKSSVFR